MNPYDYSNAPPGYGQFGQQQTNVFMSTPDTYAPTPPPPSSYTSAQSGSIATSALSHSTSLDFSNPLVHKNDFDFANQLVTSSSDITISLMPAIDPSVMVPPNSRTMATTTTTNSNSNDFTKRKNWDQRIIEELTDFLHVLSPVGKILFASPSSMELIGYTPDELLGRSITDFLHSDDIDMFIREYNVAIHTRSEFKVYYRFRKKDDKFVTFEVIGHPYFGGAGESDIPKCFFGIAQPYPTKAGTMLDSFLELKIENEKLRKQLALLQAAQHHNRRRSSTTKHMEKTFSSSEESTTSSAAAELSNSVYASMADPQRQGVQPQHDNSPMLFGSNMEINRTNNVGMLSTIEFGASSNETSSTISVHPLNSTTSTDATRPASAMPTSDISPTVVHKKQYDGGVTIPTGVSGTSSQDKDAKAKQRKKVNKESIQKERGPIKIWTTVMGIC